MALSSKDKLLAAVIANGWELDTTQTVNTFRGWGSFSRLTKDEQAKYIKQDPHAFVKPAAHGGTWAIKLDYNERGSYNRTGKRLWGVRVRYIDPQGVEQPIPLLAERSSYDKSVTPAALYNPSTTRWARYNSSLFVVTADSYDTPLAKRVEKLVQDPDTVIWLAAEDRHNDEVRWAKEAEAKRIDYELRQRPLPEGWSVLVDLARQVIRADGKTDTAALLAQLSAAVEAIDTAPVQVG